MAKQCSYPVHMQKYFHCPVCNLEIDECNREPTLLPCFHTICKECLNKHLRSDTLICPICWKCHKIRGKHTRRFQRDSSLIYLLQYYRNDTNVSAQCNKCNVDRTPQFLCSNCEDVFCIHCVKRHRNLKLASKHVLINLEDIKNAAVQEREEYRYTQCSILGHEDFRVDRYCSSKICKTAICSKCSNMEHSDPKLHKIQDLTVVFSKCKQEMISLSIDLESNKQKADIKMEEVQQELEKSNFISENVEKDIEKLSVDGDKEKIKKRARHVMSKKISILKQDLESLQNHIDNIYDARRAAKVSLTFKTMVDVVADKENIIPSLKVLKKEIIRAYPSVSLHMRYEPGHSDAADQVRGSGTLLSTMAYAPYTQIDIPTVLKVNETVTFSIFLKDSKRNIISEKHLDVVTTFSKNGPSSSDQKILCASRGNCFVCNYTPVIEGKYTLYVWAIQMKVLLGSTTFNVTEDHSLSEKGYDSQFYLDNAGQSKSEEKIETEPVRTFNFIRLGYEVQAFPKLRHLQREFRILSKSLKHLLRIIDYTILNDFISQLRKATSQSEVSTELPETEGHITIQTDSLFLLKDLEKAEIEMGDLWVHIIVTEEQTELAEHLISPKVAPVKRHKYDDESDIKFFWNSGERESGISSRLYGPPAVYLCWIPSEFPQCIQSQICSILRRFRKKTLAKFTFLTESKDVSGLKNVLQELFPEVFCKSDLPIVICANQDEVRKHSSLTLAGCIFDRLDVLRKVLLSSLRNIREIQKSGIGCSVNCLQTIIEKVDLKEIDPSWDKKTDEFDRKCSALYQVLDKKLFHVHSLLRERPNNRKDEDYKVIPKELIENLSRLKSRGVTAFGVWVKEFRVYIDCSSQTDDDIKKLETEIKIMINQEFENSRFIHCKGPLLMKYIEKGDKLIPDKSKMESYGTLGIFAKDESKQLVALTSGHVALKGKEIFVNIDENPVSLGICHITTTNNAINLTDLSLIKINEDLHSNCNIKFLNEGDEVLKPELFTGETKELIEKFVYKKGATTNWTSGGVKGEHIDLNNPGPFITVESFGDEPFAQPGDSGSVVFMHDNEDTEHSKIYLVSMVTGGGEKVTGPNGALTFRLDEAIKHLPKKSNLDFNLSNENDGV